MGFSLNFFGLNFCCWFYEISSPKLVLNLNHWDSLARLDKRKFRCELQSIAVTLRGYTQRNLFQISLNQTEIKLYSLCTDWFGSKRKSVWIQINWKMLNTIWFQVDLIRFRKYFSICRGISLRETDRHNCLLIREHTFQIIRCME